MSKSGPWGTLHRYFGLERKYRLFKTKQLHRVSWKVRKYIASTSLLKCQKSVRVLGRFCWQKIQMHGTQNIYPYLALLSVLCWNWRGFVYNISEVKMIWVYTSLLSVSSGMKCGVWYSWIALWTVMRKQGTPTPTYKLLATALSNRRNMFNIALY